MAHHERKEEDGKREHMGGKHHKGSKHHGMGKKEAGFGSKMRHHGKHNSMEGPHK